MGVVSRKEYEEKASKAPSLPPQAVAMLELPDVGETPAPESFEEPPAKRKPNGSDPWYYLQHPECTDSFKPECEIEIAGEIVEVKGGRVETQIKAVRDELIRREWRWMNEEF